METVCEYTDKTAFFSSDEKKWINRIKKLAQDHPDELTIIRQPEENDGCIYVRFPAHWFKISPPRRLNLSDEQRAASAERLKSYRKTTTQF